MNKDLISMTDIDVSIAIDTLLKNINAFLIKEEIERLATGDELQDLMILWQDTYKPHNLLAPSQETLFSQVTDMSNQMEATVEEFWQKIPADQKLSDEAHRQLALEMYRISNHHRVATKLAEQLQKDLELLEQSAVALRDLNAHSSWKVYNRLNRLLTRADLLGDYTHMWTIYEKAWMQRSESPENVQHATYAGDAVVHSLYREIEDDKKLRVKIPGNDLVTVFYESRLFTRVSKVPTPYVVAPYWGVELVWNWLAFGHEVGHHVYANVGEEITSDYDIIGISLGDELFVHVMAYLLTLSNKIWRRIWTNWIEEIFADLFCLLCFGPISVQSMQHMFFHLPAKGFKRFLKPPPQQLEWLLRADDEKHPIPYLRVYLGLNTLELLEKWSQDNQSEMADHLHQKKEELQERWDAFFVEESELLLCHHYSGGPLSPLEMRLIGQNVLRIMLYTPLYALRKKEDSQPRSLVNVFFDPDDKKIDIDKVSNVHENLVSIEKTLDFYNSCLYGEEYLFSEGKNSLKIRHILAALQLQFERIIAEKENTDIIKENLGQLSQVTINLFRQYEEERLRRKMPSFGTQDVKF